jgi:hypothetical protein
LGVAREKSLLAWATLLSRIPSNHVVVCQPRTHAIALMGELSARALKLKGVWGYVVDGACRDMSVLKATTLSRTVHTTGPTAWAQWLSCQAMWNAAMDVAVWRRNLGFDQYEQKLPRQQDLRGPAAAADGRRSQGHRLLCSWRWATVARRDRCVGRRKASCGLPRFSPKPASPKDFQVLTERRPITVMFCDLVGSTSLAAKLDAEDWRKLVSAYLNEASMAVTGLGGYILKKLGDWLMALLGYPNAQENDAELTVKAALEIRARGDQRQGAPGIFDDLTTLRGGRNDD